MKCSRIVWVWLFALGVLMVSAENQDLDSQEQKKWVVDSVSEYEGLFLANEEDSTYYGRAIITSYAKNNNLYLSICLIEVSDIAMKPKYKIFSDVRSNSNGEIIDSNKTKLGRFMTFGEKNNEKIKCLVMAGRTYIRSTIK
jgi:hypothetical protein